MSFPSRLLFWNHKTPADNAWHPYPGSRRGTTSPGNPQWLDRIDLTAAVVDSAPFVCGAGGLAHLLQLPRLGWTVPASVLRNPMTMTAMHRATLFLLPAVQVLQAAGVEYRYVIPRWAHARERRRDESEVRQQVDVGMDAGAVVWVVRLVLFRKGRAYWAPIEPVIGGALADLAHREYVKAHGL